MACVPVSGCVMFVVVRVWRERIEVPRRGEVEEMEGMEKWRGERVK